jgi:hypothetical protein
MVAAAVALKVAVVDAAGTVTEAGTVREVLLLESATVEPAVPLRVSVQTLELPGPSDVGVHVRAVIFKGATTEIEPPVAVTEIPVPPGDAPMVLITPIAAVPVTDDIVTETAATMPL